MTGGRGSLGPMRSPHLEKALHPGLASAESISPCPLSAARERTAGGWAESPTAAILSAFQGRVSATLERSHFSAPPTVGPAGRATRCGSPAIRRRPGSSIEACRAPPNEESPPERGASMSRSSKATCHGIMRRLCRRRIPCRPWTGGDNRPMEAGSCVYSVSRGCRRRLRPRIPGQPWRLCTPRSPRW